MQNNEVFPIKPCTLETIDVGLVEYLKNEFNIHVFTNSGFRKVPVIWVGSERAHQLKSDVQLRDTSGKLKLPLISVERTSMQKDPTFKGAIQADIRPRKGQGRDYVGGAFKVVSKINQEKTSARQHAKNFNNADWKGNPFSTDYGREIVMDEYLVPIPTYVAVTYSITLRCEYQQQMNQMVLPFISKTGQVNHFVYKQDGHRFESFIQQEFSQENNLASLNEEERKFQTKVDIKVLGYVIGEGVNEPRPKIVKRETIAKLHAVTEMEYTPGTGQLNSSGFGESNSNGSGYSGPSQITINDQCYIAASALQFADPESQAATTATTGADQADTEVSYETSWRLVNPQDIIPGQGWVNMEGTGNEYGNPDNREKVYGTDCDDD